jgi:phosphoenolpyruvate carboxylase
MSLNTEKKYHIYNSLFLNLDYQNSPSVGQLIPVLGQLAQSRLEAGENPIDIFDEFYEDHKEIIGGSPLDFMFKVVQYVERQVVLFDSVEDSTPAPELEDSKPIQISDLQPHAEAERADFLDLLNQIKLRIVLTAHPTQFYRPPVLDIMANMRQKIRENDLFAIDRLLHQLGLTSLINTQSPSPFDEAMNVLHMIRYEYYDAIGRFVYELEQKYPGFEQYQILGLGFWPCGDRDGNPFVTHEVTREVIDALHMTLMKCYYKDLKELRSRLTFKGIEQELITSQEKVYRAMFDPTSDYSHKELLLSLEKVRATLKEAYEDLSAEKVDQLITKVKVFQDHFATLDIRQDHSVHLEAVNYVLKVNGHPEAQELDDAELTRLLTQEMLQIPDEIELEGPALDTCHNIAQLPGIQEKNGELACHRYIISNSEDRYGILFPYALFRWIHKTEEINFDIVPLFESMDGMARCKDIMDDLYSLDVYRKHLKARGDHQTIMLGFSDGTKDGGYLKANWSIYKSKEVLSEVSAKHDVELTFFDGRGGPPARGGGKTHNFYAAMGKAVAKPEIQLTIQGQTITSTYGTGNKFLFNAEQIISSGLISLGEEGVEISTEDRALIEDLSERSYAKYTELKHHPKFIEYLEEMTTLRYYARAKIGSRPGKRNKTTKLTLADLRAISYVGSWSQLKQNIPGYYGLGSALKEVKAERGLDELKALYRSIAFFKTLIDNAMMSLSKCFFELTFYMRDNKDFGPFWEILYAEYELSKEMTLEISGTSSLMENEPASRDSIALRDEIVMPLLLIQHYALQMLNTKADPKNKEVYEKLVIRSLYGNINASRNSA